VLNDPWLHRVLQNGIPILKPSLVLSSCLEAADMAMMGMPGFPGE